MSVAAKEISIPRDELISVATEILVKAGAPEDKARSVAESLISAQEAGHPSHGLIRLIEYVSFVKKGTVFAGADPKLIGEHGAVASIDGNWGWGQVACKYALELIGERISKFGTFTITIKNVNHIGRLGEYVERLAERGLVSIMWCNSDPSVAAFGGVERLFGTNPFAVGIPTSGEPIVIDFATAASAEGKLRVARANGQQVPKGMVIDKLGVESTDPNAFYEGGSLLPFGGHKGYCMSLMIELLGGGLSGGHPATSSEYSRGNGTVLIAMDPKYFAGSENFLSEMDQSVSKISGTRPARVDQPVLLPGQVENIARAKNRSGVAVSEPIWQSIEELRSSLTIN